MVAIGCVEGVWVGVGHDSRRMFPLRSCHAFPHPEVHTVVRVLDLRMVTQCAMLEDFGLFIVLADKVRDLDPK